MKKLRMKILAPALSVIAAAAVVAPTVAVVATRNVNKVDTNVRQPLTVSTNLFDVKDGTLLGFKDNVTQEQINAYIRQNGNKLVLPACKTIGASAFKNLSTPFGTTIVIDVETTKIDKFSFYGCSTVTEITFVKGSESATAGDSMLGEIEESAFAFCSQLTTLPIPTKLETIGNSAFYGCKALRTFDFTYFTTQEEGVTVADFDAIADAVTNIGANAFTATYDPSATEETPNVFNIAINTLPSEFTVESFPLRSKLSGIAGRIASAVESTWFADGRTWIQGLVGSSTFDIDIAIPESFFSIAGGQISGILPQYKTELANAPYNAMLVTNQMQGQDITKISPTVWRDVGNYVRDLDMSTARQILAIDQNFIPIDDEGNSLATKLENVCLPSTITQIGNQAFFNVKTLDWINLNDCKSLNTIGNHAFALSGVRCFGSGPIAKPESYDVEHDISMLDINYDTGINVGEGAFWDTHLEGIKFLGTGPQTNNTSFGAGAFGGSGKSTADPSKVYTRLWKLDFSNLQFNIDFDGDETLTITKDSTASLMFKTLFLVEGTSEIIPRLVFTGALDEVVKEEGTDETANRIIAPQISFTDAADPIASGVTADKWFSNFREVETELGGEYKVVDEWKTDDEKYTKYADVSFLQAISLIGKTSKVLDTESWVVDVPAETYDFHSQPLDPQISGELLSPEDVPTSGLPFTFKYVLSQPAEYALDFDNSHFYADGVEITGTDKQKITVDATKRTITIPGQLITGDIDVALWSQEITNTPLSIGTQSEEITSVAGLPQKVYDGQKYNIELGFAAGYTLDMENTMVHLTGGTDAIDCLTWNAENKKLVLDGSKLVAEASATACQIDLIATGIKLEAVDNLDAGYEKPTLNPIDITEDYEMTFTLNDNYLYDENNSKIFIDEIGGVEVKYDAEVSDNTVTVTIEKDALATFGNNKKIIFSLKSILQTEETYNFFNLTDDTNVEAVTPSGSPTKGQKFVFTATPASNYVFDQTKSVIAVRGQNLLNVTGAVTVATDPDTGVITFTIADTWVLDDVFVRIFVAPKQP